MGRRPTSLSLDLKCLQTNKVFPTRMMPADTVDRVDLDMKWLSFLYCDGEIGHLMDNDTFDQIEFPSEMLGKHREWIPTDSKVQCTFYEGVLFSIIIPDNAVFEVLEEDNNINTRVSIPNYKSVLLNNNHKMAVPEFIKAGDKIKVRLEDQTFMIRVNE
jgi:elongation factor P